MDAHLAALALEHNASIASTDKDFSRFTNYIKVINPLNI
jgi:predicted nucleic acid-binding protein